MSSCIDQTTCKHTTAQYKYPPLGSRSSTTTNDMESIFNQKLLSFAQDLRVLNEGLSEPIPQINALETGVQITSMVDPTAPLKLFRTHVSEPYGAQIRKRDDGFFLEGNSIANDHSGDLNLVNMLRSVWTTLGTEDKSAIWGHMQLLLKLDEKIAGRRA